MTLGATKFRYVFFSFKNVANVVQSVTTSGSTNSGFNIRSAGGNSLRPHDVLPWPKLIVAFGCLDLEAQCYIPGRRAAGEVSCNFTQASFDNASPIGTVLTMPTMEWVCDRWFGTPSEVTMSAEFAATRASIRPMTAEPREARGGAG